MILKKFGAISKRIICDLCETACSCGSIGYIVALVLGYAIFVLDFFNLPTRVLTLAPTALLLVTACLALAAIIIWGLSVHVIDFFKIAAINPLDTTLVVTTTTSILYSFLREMVLGANLYPIVSSCVTFFALSVAIFRCSIRALRKERINQNSQALHDLKEIYENTFTRHPDAPVLVSECDVDYDLLDRSWIINHLYQSIIHCRPKQSYVISLEGQWGSGKTTIINATKRLLTQTEPNEGTITIIDDFDPWLYGSQEALLLAMFETVVRKTGMKYSPVRNHQMVDSVGKAIAESHVAGKLIHSLSYSAKQSEESIRKIKKRITEYLQLSEKTVVFFIDNLDRANDDNIIFLFKLINIVFDLPGIVYVLSFDRERVASVLQNTHEIDPQFIEKIIQQEIKVPAIGEEKKHNLYRICLDNLLISYGIGKDALSNFSKIVDYIVVMAPNIRTFKRLINSVLPGVFCSDTILYKYDLLSIAIIRFFEPALYDTIYKNAQYFISHEQTLSQAYKVGFDREGFNKKGQDFFDELFKQHQNCKELLSDIFPYVARYASNQPLVSEYPYYTEEDEAIIKQSRLCDGKYFDLYFSHSSNHYLQTQSHVKSVINNINAASSFSEIFGILRFQLFDMDVDTQKRWFECFQQNASDISAQNVSFVAKSLYKLLYNVSDTSGFFEKSPRTRVELVISELLERCSIEQLDNFLYGIENDYGKLRALSIFRAFLQSERKANDARRLRADKLQEKIAIMCNHITQNSINLYSDKHYQD